MSKLPRVTCVSCGDTFLALRGLFECGYCRNPLRIAIGGGTPKTHRAGDDEEEGGTSINRRLMEDMGGG